MKLVIEGDAKEIAALVLAVQERQESSFQEAFPNITVENRTIFDHIREEAQ